MLKDFISDAAKGVEYHAANSRRQDVENEESSIRINTRSVPVELPTNRFYGRARDIYFRARRARMTRAAGII